jgi:hypothetical protein
MNKDSDLSPNLKHVDFANSDESLANESFTNEMLTNESFTNETLAGETARLLSELDRAIDHSSALRNIIRRQEALLELESITGSTRKTQTLRQEITRLEQQFYAGRGDEAAVPDPSLSPA